MCSELARAFRKCLEVFGRFSERGEEGEDEDEGGEGGGISRNNKKATAA